MTFPLQTDYFETAFLRFFFPFFFTDGGISSSINAIFNRLKRFSCNNMQSNTQSIEMYFYIPGKKTFEKDLFIYWVSSPSLYI